MATGQIIVVDPSGRTGKVHIATIDSNDDCNADCEGADVRFVTVRGTTLQPGDQGKNSISMIVLAGEGHIAIDLKLA